MVHYIISYCCIVVNHDHNPSSIFLSLHYERPPSKSGPLPSGKTLPRVTLYLLLFLQQSPYKPHPQCNVHLPSRDRSHSQTLVRTGVIDLVTLLCLVSSFYSNLFSPQSGTIGTMPQTL